MAQYSIRSVRNEKKLFAQHYLVDLVDAGGLRWSRACHMGVSSVCIVLSHPCLSTMKIILKYLFLVMK